MYKEDLLLYMNTLTDNIQAVQWQLLRVTDQIEWERVLERLSDIQVTVERATVASVSFAREYGYSWVEIGNAVHVHESTARLRYKDRLQMVQAASKPRGDR